MIPPVSMRCTVTLYFELEHILWIIIINQLIECLTQDNLYGCSVYLVNTEIFVIITAWAVNCSQLDGFSSYENVNKKIFINLGNFNFMAHFWRNWAWKKNIIKKMIMQRLCFRQVNNDCVTATNLGKTFIVSTTLFTGWSSFSGR